jgi:hypothetical protein
MSSTPIQPTQPKPQAAEAFAQDRMRSHDSMARFITGGVLLVGAIIIGVALYLAWTGQDKAYAQVKDLLIFVNPFLGLVIGYYFQKSASDARAQNAERWAIEANAANLQSQIGLQAAQKGLSETRAALANLADAAEDMTESSVPPVMTKGEPGALEMAAPAVGTKRLQKALAQAQSILQATY